MFQRPIGKPRYLGHVTNVEITEVGCLEVPLHIRYTCVRGEDPLVDFRVVALRLGKDARSLFGVTDLNRLSPHTLSLEHLNELLLLEGGLPVRKHGAATGITSGRLVELHRNAEADDQLPVMPDALNPRRKVTQVTLEADRSVFLGTVEWESAGDPFADCGDSGSLVWAELDGAKVPIGLHIGSGDGYSICLLIQCIFDIIEEVYDNDYFFCGGEYCGARAKEGSDPN